MADLYRARFEGRAPRVGAQEGTVPVRVLGGVSNVIIYRPEGVAAQVHVDGGSTNLAFDDQRFGAVGGEVRLQSPDYQGASDRYDITITGGASNLTIDAG